MCEQCNNLQYTVYQLAVLGNHLLFVFVIPLILAHRIMTSEILFRYRTFYLGYLIWSVNCLYYKARTCSSRDIIVILKGSHVMSWCLQELLGSYLS